MGKEAECTCRWNGQTGRGKALLETDEVLFRGDFRVVMPLKEMTAVEAVDGELHLRSAHGQMTLTLGEAAAKWADRILHPPTRPDKLGVKAGLRVAIVGLEDPEFHRELTDAKAQIVTGKSAAEVDLLFFAAESRADLKNIAGLKKKISQSGAIWILYPKGIQMITEANVFDAGHEAKLVDVKIARFSDRLTALKFVIPVVQRKTEAAVKPKPRKKNKTGK